MSRRSRRSMAVASSCALIGALGAGSAHAASSVYVSDRDANKVSQFDVGAGGLLSPKLPAAVDVQDWPALAPAITPDGLNAYVGSIRGASIFLFDVAPDGRLIPKKPAAVRTDGSGWVAVSPDGQSAYAANFLGGAVVAQFDIAADGRLTPKTPPTVPTGGQPFGVAVNPDGRSVYVPNEARPPCRSSTSARAEC